jgi:hypothetical protein
MSDLKKQQGKCLLIIWLHINTNCEKFQMVLKGYCLLKS